MNDEDKFCINQNFKQQLFRIKINQIQAKETVFPPFFFSFFLLSSFLSFSPFFFPHTFFNRKRKLPKQIKPSLWTANTRSISHQQTNNISVNIFLTFFFLSSFPRQVDATVVRIMKTRKTLSHNLLVAELYKQLKFPLEVFIFLFLFFIFIFIYFFIYLFFFECSLMPFSLSFSFFFLSFFSFSFLSFSFFFFSNL